jgi:hypothetical protein
VGGAGRGAGAGKSCMAGGILADAAKADARARACSPRPATKQTLPSPARCAGVIKGEGAGMALKWWAWVGPPRLAFRRHPRSATACRPGAGPACRAADGGWPN